MDNAVSSSQHHSDIGCLLIHGFSGHPADLQPLADALAADGYAVRAPMLPGHGLSEVEMQQARWRQWAESVEQAHDELRACCRRIVMIGHSMGGALAITEAAQRTPDLLVLIGVPTFIGDWRVRFIPVAKYAVRWWYPLTDAALDDPITRERILQKSPDLDLRDPAVRLAVRRHARVPMSAVDHFFRLTRHARKRIRAIRTPTLVVQGRHDTVAVPACAEEIYRDLGSADKQLAWIDGGHQLLIGIHSRETVERIRAWMTQRLRI